MSISRHSRKTELHTGELQQPAPETHVMPGVQEPFTPPKQVILPIDRPLTKDHLEALEFSEEPVIIRIEPPSGENPPKVQPCWVNGKGAEIFEGNRWTSYGFFPIGRVLCTKRKYVEALFNSKRVFIKTLVVDLPDGEKENRVTKIPTSSCTLSIIEDRSPKGSEWATRLIASQ